MNCERAKSKKRDNEEKNAYFENLNESYMLYENVGLPNSMNVQEKLQTCKMNLYHFLHNFHTQSLIFLLNTLFTHGKFT